MYQIVILTHKKRQVQADLEQWAEQVRLLQPGERLVFSLEIEQTPPVIETAPRTQRLLDRPAVEFFTKERLMKTGCSAHTASRIAGIISYWNNDGSGREKRSPVVATLRAFIFFHPTTAHMARHIAWMGKVTAGLCAQALKAEGIELAG